MSHLRESSDAKKGFRSHATNHMIFQIDHMAFKKCARLVQIFLAWAFQKIQNLINRASDYRRQFSTDRTSD